MADADGKGGGQVFRKVSIQEWITLVGVLTTGFLVVTGYLGRAYAEAYYSALNIPPALITISLRDYSIIGWPVVLVSLIVVFAATAVFTIVAASGAIAANMPPHQRKAVSVVVFGAIGTVK